MNVHDWALIVFTILVQMSVGSMWVLGIAHYFANRKYGMEEADQLSDRALITLVPVIALGFLASLFHLGVPLNAYRAVSNLGSSWLSREIFFGVLFAVSAFAFAFMQWRKIGTFNLRNVIAWVAALVGLVLVYCMAKIYMLQTQPAWNSWATPVTFFTTTFLLGVLAMGAALVANYGYIQRKNPGSTDTQSVLLRQTLRWLALAAVVLLGVEFVAMPIYLGLLAAGPDSAIQTARLTTQTFGWALVLRLVLSFLGAGVFMVFLYQNALSARQEKVFANLAYTAFAMVFVAEILGRFLFYVTHVRIGV
jgi:anaerobic dimethyl sulfoxide reductase subunit C (anchor subunit)